MTVTVPRIVYVTAGFPFPLSSGYLRHHHLLRALAPDHDVALRSLVGPDFDPARVDGVAGLTTDVEVFERRPAGRVRRSLDLATVPSHRPEAAALARRVADDVSRDAAALVLSGKDTAPVIDAVAGRVPVVVDLCDATSARVTQQIRCATPLARAPLALRRRRLRAVERRLVERGDVLVTASARDRELLRAEGAPRRVLDAEVLPNGVDLDHWRRRTPTLGTEVLLVGNLAYRPNADAARLLVHRIMPLVWSTRPRARAVIVGPGAPTDLTGSGHPSVEVTGEVPDVRPLLERAAVVAAPLRMATGIQNKLLEALAMGIPVVTSSVAAAGLGPDAPLTVADAPEAAAAAIVDRLDAAAGGDAPADGAARDWVGRVFDWERSGRLLRDVLGRARDREQVRW